MRKQSVVKSNEIIIIIKYKQSRIHGKYFSFHFINKIHNHFV